ncbi:MAG: ImmA/IrrE family metallo-endopeptidase [Thermoguttaceae bacterium]
MLSEHTHEELIAGLDHVAADLLRQADVRRPPVDAIAMARALGITLAWDDRQQGRARYVRLHGRAMGRPIATILLRPDPRRERQQWAVAHEIGEHAAHCVFDYWGDDPRVAPPNAREQVANQLAGRLLLPTDWFAADGSACAWDLIALKARYTTASHELIARRMLDCCPPVIISIFDQRRLSFRRGNVEGRVPPPLPSEMACWRRVHEECRPRRAWQGPGVVQGWPVHEGGWKREILRMELSSMDEEPIMCR